MSQSFVVSNQSTPEYYFDEGCHITEWLNSPADERLSIARARVVPGVATRLHRLHGVTERYVILQGVGRVEIDRAPPAIVRAGDIVVIPAGVPQRIANCSQEDLVFLALCSPRFSPDCYEDIEAASDRSLLEPG